VPILTPYPRRYKDFDSFEDLCFAENPETSPNRNGSSGAGGLRSPRRSSSVPTFGGSPIAIAEQPQ
jgi:hypothetical protein